MILGGLVNLATTFIAAKVTGQDYSWTDAGVAFISGVAGVVFGPLAAGGVSAVGTFVVNMSNGMSFGQSVVTGISSGLASSLTMGGIAKMAKVPLTAVETLVVDFISGIPANSISASITRSIKEITRKDIVKGKQEYLNRTFYKSFIEKSKKKDKMMVVNFYENNINSFIQK